MMSQTQDSKDIDAIADLVAHCRDSARNLRLDTLTYYLDMAFVAACSDLRRLRTGVDDTTLRKVLGNSSNGADADELRFLDLKAIQTAIEGCLNWARDLDRSTLVYVLRMSLHAASTASNDRV